MSVFSTVVALMSQQFLTVRSNGSLCIAATPSAADEIEDDDDDFILFSQNNYERGSQPFATTPNVQKSNDTQVRPS